MFLLAVPLRDVGFRLDVEKWINRLHSPSALTLGSGDGRGWESTIGERLVGGAGIEGELSSC